MKKYALRPVLLRPLRILPPLPFSMLAHFLYQGELTTFRNPRTFTELVTAKKLYDKNPIYIQHSDKLAVRDYVAERVGEKYLIPLLQAVNDPADIDFDNLPAPYVIKARHGYNMNIFVHPNQVVDRDAVLRETRKWMSSNVYDLWKEWAYKYCPKGIVVEQFVGEGTKPLADYKFWTFHGKAGIIQINHDRYEKHELNLFDIDWNDLELKGLVPRRRPSPPRPENIDEMISVAEKLAAGLDSARIDLYTTGDRIYFGEITHYPGAGTVRHKPRDFDLALGELWRNGTPIPERFRARD